MATAVKFDQVTWYFPETEEWDEVGRIFHFIIDRGIEGWGPVRIARNVVAFKPLSADM